MARPKNSRLARTANVLIQSSQTLSNANRSSTRQAKAYIRLARCATST